MKKLKGRAIPIDFTIGESLCAFRKSAHLTQAQLASAVGVTFQQIQKYQSGRDWSAYEGG